MRIKHPPKRKKIAEKNEKLQIQTCRKAAQSLCKYERDMPWKRPRAEH